MFRENGYQQINYTGPQPFVYPGMDTIKLSDEIICIAPAERLDFIMRVVAQEFKRRFPFDIEKMLSKTREQPYAVARMSFYHFARMQCPTLTLREIAAAIPGKKQHHTTLLHAFTTVQNLLDTKDELYYDVLKRIEERTK